MNERVVIAQAAPASAAADAPRIVEVIKPANGQALTLTLGYTQAYKLDLSKIASEKLTLVHVGEKLVILFDNQATVTVEPFFDSSRHVIGNVSFDVGGDRIINAEQFAAAFPITDDQSVLPAAGNAQGANAQAGANFHDPSIDPLGTPNPLSLLGQEELGNFVIAQQPRAIADPSAAGTGGGGGGGGGGGDVPTVLGSMSLSLHEPSLDLVKDAPDLLAGLTIGTNPSGTTETATGSSGLTFTAPAAETMSVAFADPSGAGNAPGVSGLAIGYSMTWALNASGQLEGTLWNGQNSLGVVIVIELSGTLAVAAGGSVTPTVTATLINNLIHDTGNGNVAISGIKIEATDQSGDKVQGNLGLTVYDDAPLSPIPDASVLANSAQATKTSALDFDINIDDNLGADHGTVRFASSLNGTNSGLTSGGLPIIYTLSLDGLTLTAATAIGTIFTVVLNPDGSYASANDTYTVTMFGAIDGATNTTIFTPQGTNFHGGNDPWAGFYDASNNNSHDILLTPIVNGTYGDTINANSNQVGVGGGNSVDPTEGMRIDFVIDLAGNPAKVTGPGSPNPNDYTASVNRDHTFDAHDPTNGVYVNFSGIAGQDPQSTILFRAFDDPDGAGNYVVGDGTQDSINVIAIRYNSVTEFVYFSVIGTTQTTVNVGGHDFTVHFVDNANVTGTQYDAIVGGVVNGADVATYTASGYNSLEVYHSGGENFKIGGFGTTTIVNSVPVGASLPIELIDGDGDLATGDISLAFTQSGSTVQDFGGSGTPVSATASAGLGEHIIGSNFDDTLTGDGVANILNGGLGSDTLIGGGGGDYLIGGGGGDHFRINATTDGMDHILDFASAQGDVIDILGSAFGGLSAGALAASLFSTQTDGTFDNNTQRFAYDQTSHILYYDADGSDAGAAIALAKLENGATLTSADIQVV